MITNMERRYYRFNDHPNLIVAVSVNRYIYLLHIQNRLDALKGIDSSLISTVLGTDLDLNSLSTQLSLFTSEENQQLLSMLGSVSGYADCISLDRWVENCCLKIHSEHFLISAMTKTDKIIQFIIVSVKHHSFDILYQPGQVDKIHMSENSKLLFPNFSIW